MIGAASRKRAGPGTDRIDVKAIGLGAGGHARVVLEVLAAAGGCEIVGLLDPRQDLWGTDVHGVKVLGGDDLLDGLFADGVRATFLGLGVATDCRPRIRLYQVVRSKGFEMLAAIHPTAVIARSASIGRAANIFAGAIVNAAARIGENVIVNTGAIVEHDCEVHDHAHLATGVRLGGSAVIGEGAFIGMGTCVLPNVRVGCQSVVGAGAVVVSDVPDYCVAVGMPARVIRTIDP